MSLNLALKAVIRMLTYLSHSSEYAGRDFVPVSRVAADLGLPNSLLSLVALRLGRAGHVRIKGSAPDEVAFSDGVMNETLAEVVSEIYGPSRPEEWIRAGMGKLGRLPVRDLLLPRSAKPSVPIYIKATAAAVLAVVFSMAAIGLYKVPAAFAGLGLTLLLLTYTLHWIGRRRNLQTLPQCVLEAGMAGSLLWVVFGFADLLG